MRHPGLNNGPVLCCKTCCTRRLPSRLLILSFIAEPKARRSIPEYEAGIRCITAHDAEIMVDWCSDRMDFIEHLRVPMAFGRNCAKMALHCRSDDWLLEPTGAHSVGQKLGWKPPRLSACCVGTACRNVWRIPLRTECHRAGALEQGKKQHVPEMCLRF